MLNDFLNLIGIKAPTIIAGFSGAVARVGLLGTGGIGVIQTILGVLGGTLAAVYLGPLGPSYLGWQQNAAATSAITFLVGMFGLEVTKQIGQSISRRLPIMKRQQQEGTE